MNDTIKCPHCNQITTFQIVNIGATDSKVSIYLSAYILKCTLCDKFISLISKDMVVDYPKPPKDEYTKL